MSVTTGPGPKLRGRVEKSDEVKTTDSVKTLYVGSIEELEIRSMSLYATKKY